MTLIRLNTRHPAVQRLRLICTLIPFENLRAGNGAQ